MLHPPKKSSNCMNALDLTGIYFCPFASYTDKMIDKISICDGFIFRMQSIARGFTFIADFFINREIINSIHLARKYARIFVSFINDLFPLGKTVHFSE